MSWREITCAESDALRDGDEVLVITAGRTSWEGGMYRLYSRQDDTLVLRETTKYGNYQTCSHEQWIEE